MVDCLIIYNPEHQSPKSHVVRWWVRHLCELDSIGKEAESSADPEQDVEAEEHLLNELHPRRKFTRWGQLIRTIRFQLLLCLIHRQALHWTKHSECRPMHAWTCACVFIDMSRVYACLICMYACVILYSI